MIAAPWAIAALFTLHCALPIAAAWWGTQHIKSSSIAEVLKKPLLKAIFTAKLKYTVLVPLAMAATWLTMLTAPLIALGTQRNGRLWWWLRWAGTHDAWQFAFTTQLGREPLPQGWLQRYWSSLRWLWRNPAYHFAHHVCGYQARRGVVTESNDLQDAVITGTREDGLYAVAPWGNAFFVTVMLWRLQVGAGWKLWRTDEQDADGVCMLATKIGWIK